MYEFFLYPAFIIAILVSLYAQIKVSTTFNKYSRVNTFRGKTAAETAQMILSSNGLYDVRIERVPGNLTDHYDPRSNVLRLSDSVYSSSSAAAVGVAAHEAGHAIQHAKGYLPIVLRSKLVPVTNFASRISWIVILLGALMSFFAGLNDIGYLVIMAGIGLFSVTAVFQLVTLPCEFNASKRAKQQLLDLNIITDYELDESKTMLNAAALTYVAAVFTTLLQILRLALIVLRKSDD